MFSWLICAAYIAFAFMAFAKNIAGAQNVITAWIWLSAVVYSFLILGADKVAQAVATNPSRRILRAVSTSACAIVAITLAWRSEFFLCGLVCFSLVISAGIHDMAEKIRAKPTENKQG